jgi:large subunit ribosomal protein L4
MPTVKVYDNKGKEAGELKLSDDVFAPRSTRSRVVEGEEIEFQRNLDATLHQAVLAEEANSRQGTHKVKTRGEVRGGGRKPYRQKKTGRARQGSTRSPVWPGGGTVFGPEPRSYAQGLNRKTRRLALRIAMGAKIAGGNVVVVDGIKFERFKTADAVEFLKAHGGDVPRTLVLLAEHDPFAVRSFRNLQSVELRTAPDISTRDIVIARRIIADKAALQRLEELWSK